MIHHRTDLRPGAPLVGDCGAAGLVACGWAVVTCPACIVHRDAPAHHHVPASEQGALL